MLPLRTVLLLAVLLLAALSFACGDDDDDAGDDATQVPTETESGDTAAPEAEHVTADEFSPTFTVDLPADWRVSQVDNGVLVVRHSATDSSPPGQLWFSQLSSVYDTTDDNAPLETPGDLAAFIRGHPWLEVLDEEAVEIGGLAGVKFEIRPDTAVVPSPLQEWWSIYEETIGTYNIYDGDHVAFYVLDGPDEQFVMAYAPDDPTLFEEFTTEAEQVIATVEFAEASVATDAAPDEPVAFESTQFEPPITGEVGSGWAIDIDEPGVFVLRHDPDITGPLGYLGVSYPRQVWSYDGLTKQDLPADLTEWVKEHPRLTVRSEQSVTVGGLAGTQLELVSSEGEDWNFLEQDDGTFQVFRNDHFLLTVLDRAGTPTTIFSSAQNHPEEPSRYEDFREISQPVVDSLEFAE